MKGSKFIININFIAIKLLSFKYYIFEVENFASFLKLSFWSSKLCFIFKVWNFALFLKLKAFLYFWNSKLSFIFDVQSFPLFLIFKALLYFWNVLLYSWSSELSFIFEVQNFASLFNPESIKKTMEFSYNYQIFNFL